MNELTGAFLIAQEKGENLVLTRQSLANSGYPVQEIEEAFMEANQLIQKKRTVSEVVQPKKKNWMLFFWIAILVIAIIGSAVFFFWEEIFKFMDCLMKRL